MSNSQKQARLAPIMLLKITESGHFGTYRNEVEPLLNKIVDSYTQDNQNEATEKELEQLKTKIFAMDEKLAESGIYTNLTMMFSMLLVISEYFLNYVQGAKQQAWSNLHQYCYNVDIIKHFRKKDMWQYGKTLDEAEVISEIILNTESCK